MAYENTLSTIADIHWSQFNSGVLLAQSINYTYLVKILVLGIIISDGI